MFAVHLYLNGRLTSTDYCSTLNEVDFYREKHMKFEEFFNVDIYVVKDAVLPDIYQLRDNIFIHDRSY